MRTNSDFSLINPRTKQTVSTISASTLFDKIVEYSHRNGEPGVLFLDAANRANPVPKKYTLESTNPCGEQFLGPYENCCLASVNLAKHVRALKKVNDEDSEESSPAFEVDWDKLAKTVRLTTRFLDDVITANKYVPAVPQLKEAAHQVRRMGLGIMGLADMMYMLRVRYGAKDSLELAGQLMEFVRFHCMCESMEMAKEKGSFPAIKDSIFDPDNFLWRHPVPLEEFKLDFGRPRLPWESLEADIKKFGIRNGAHTTVAPTGTIGTITSCEGFVASCCSHSLISGMGANQFLHLRTRDMLKKLKEMLPFSM